VSRTNFLLFITDQQRADHIGAYGNPVVRTPNIDRLAKNGWLAERCYVASPICMPNRSSLLTGRLPSAHRARHNGIPLPFAETTFVERLHAGGYHTALVGKSHLQNMTGLPPSWPRPSDPKTEGEARRPEPGRFDQEWGPSWNKDPAFGMSLPFYGFQDVRLVIDHGDTAGGHYRRWLEQEHPEVAALTGQQHAIPTPGYALSACKQAWRTRVPEELSTTSYIGSQTCELLERYAASDEPFFLQCSFPDPHHPFTPPGRFWDMYRPEEMELPASFYGQSSGPVPHLDWMHAQRDAGKAVKHTPAMFASTERETREALALNYGSIAHIDETIGRVLGQLQKLGLAENTVVLFTSDHGDFFGDHQLLWKGPLHYQGLIRVPLIWADPGAAGKRSAQLCSTIDIAPTILQRAGCMPYNGIQGLSLLPAIAEEATLGRAEILIEEENQRVLFDFPNRTRMRTLQTQRYRLSVYEGVEWGELYDLENDPQENHNLWDDTRFAALRGELLHRLAKAMIHYADTSPNPTALA
jgi:arylsulfatase